MNPRYKLIRNLLAMILLTVMVGCQKTILIRTSLSEIPETLNNIPYVAVGHDIRIGIEGTTDYYVVDVDGYYLVHKNDMAAIVEELKR